jgi:hypothetical protein
VEDYAMMRPMRSVRLRPWILVLLAACPAGSTGTTLYQVDVSGTGSGVITSSPSGINCTLTQGVTSGTCSASFPGGKQVLLTQTAASDWTFLGWGGQGCAAGVTCQVTPSQNLAVSVQFARAGGPGLMQLNLGSAGASAAGMVVTISGGGITAVTPASSYQIQTSTLPASSVTLLVRGDLVVGKLADLQVLDRTAAFTVTVQTVAAGAAGGYAPVLPALFQVGISRP